MRKEALIYGTIDSYSSAEFISCINDNEGGEQASELIVRVNSDGGEVR